jgi:hypothetical protein
MKGEQPDTPRSRVRRPRNWYSHIARREQSTLQDKGGAGFAVWASVLIVVLLVAWGCQTALGF